MLQATAKSRGNEGQSLIQARGLVKVYSSPAGDFTALKQLDVQVNRGEFVAVIGKSGCGKSTFINMLTGIDRPTSGEIWIGDTAIHALNEDQMAQWRGRNLGIVFQSFQLLPTLTLLENIMLPMELNDMYTKRERRERAMQLLSMVGVADHAHKLPSAISGGQQQRVAIARSLANDPLLIVADEPTGNLDSKTSEQIFKLFEELVADGKTILMVTHDDDQARRVQRTIILSDGQIVNEYLARALAAISRDQLDTVARLVEPLTYPPGAHIVRQGEVGDKFYIILEGQAEVLVEQPGGTQMLVERLGQGEYFGEMALIGNGLRTATVRAAEDSQVQVVALDTESFNQLLNEAPALLEELAHIADQRMVHNYVQALSALESQPLRELTRGLASKSYQPGQTIIRQGEIGKTFYLIMEGKVEIVVERPDGREMIINQLQKGQYFGEMALLENERRNATVRVSGSDPVKVVELDREMLDRLLRESDAFKQKFAQLKGNRQESSDLPAVAKPGRTQGGR